MNRFPMLEFRFGKPWSEKSSGLGKAVSTILFHSCTGPYWTWNSNASQYALIIA